MPFSGWFLTPKLRYYLYVWSSNVSQGDPAQVVGAGNLSYVFNRYLTLGGGITSLPSVRSTEGQFPYWLTVDNRIISDEFFRGSYTSGVWIKGQLAAGANYMAMLGNNLSTLGVSAAQLNNGLNTTSVSLRTGCPQRRSLVFTEHSATMITTRSCYSAWRTLHLQSRGQAGAAGYERDREQPDPSHGREHHLHTRTFRTGNHTWSA